MLRVAAVELPPSAIAEPRLYVRHTSPERRDDREPSCRPHPQAREAGRSTGAGTDKYELVINLQNRQGALPDHAAYLGDLRIDQRIAFVRIRW
jgi:hypothetical protein